jgi:hypothetical protein
MPIEISITSASTSNTYTMARTSFSLFIERAWIYTTTYDQLIGKKIQKLKL